MAKAKNTNEIADSTPDVKKIEVIELTLARALNEVKMLNKRIEKESFTNTFLTTKKGKDSTAIKKVNDFTSVANAIKSLSERRAMIKNAIALKNATTKISAAGYDMTITAALALKEVLPFQEQLLSNVKSNLNSARREVKNMNTAVDERLQSLLVASFGKDKRPGENDVSLISEQFLNANLIEIVDEELTASNVDAYSNMLETFKNEIDFALSEANATNKIQLPA